MIAGDVTMRELRMWYVAMYLHMYILSNPIGIHDLGTPYILTL